MHRLDGRRRLRPRQVHDPRRWPGPPLRAGQAHEGFQDGHRPRGLLAPEQGPPRASGRPSRGRRQQGRHRAHLPPRRQGSHLRPRRRHQKRARHRPHRAHLAQAPRPRHHPDLPRTDPQTRHPRRIHPVRRRRRHCLRPRLRGALRPSRRSRLETLHGRRPRPLRLIHGTSRRQARRRPRPRRRQHPQLPPLAAPPHLACDFRLLLLLLRLRQLGRPPPGRDGRVALPSHHTHTHTRECSFRLFLSPGDLGQTLFPRRMCPGASSGPRRRTPQRVRCAELMLPILSPSPSSSPG
mmetsp:Transcript_21020/g.66031  ORF Transcript_21020/g.66031 Transcript_21020/m.66031 type:complete len:294 (+) Transcript_21020:1828-2709(+)